MKTKNLTLGLVAFVFAMGTAFASLTLVNETAYVEAQFGSATGSWICNPLDVECNFVANGTPCQVKVITTSTPLGEVLDAKRATCVDLLRSNTQGIQEGVIEDEPTPFDVR